MQNSAKANVETKKNWAAPELKKTSIEQITANHQNGSGSDGYFNRHS